MDFPDEWQNYQANGGPNLVPGAWSSGLLNSSSQTSSLLHDTRQDQPRSIPSEHGLPQDQDPINVPPIASEDQGSGTVSQDNNQNRGQDQMRECNSFLKFTPLSGWTGPTFNKARHVYVNHVPMLMSNDEIEQSRNFERYRLHSVSFELCEGDVLVFIDYPDYHKEAIKHTDCNGLIYKSQKFRVHSKKLLETNSSTFEEMLSPTYQFRIQRRRKMVNKMPEGIKYLLDLTPPSEGDELVFQMTELSLTPALLKWWRSSTENETDLCLVSGHDDVCMCDRQPTFSRNDKCEENSTSTDQGDSDNSGNTNGSTNRRDRSEAKPPFGDKIEVAARLKARGENEFFPTPFYRRSIPDYCPVRHRNGIVRLLMLIEGKGVILDSAPRMWTLVKLGSIFDCSSLLRDRVTQWILHGSNTTFIEVAPEEALQIAFILKIPEVAQSAFRILVNELALKLAGKDEPHQDYKHTTIFGRRLGSLPDELNNLVQHAAQAFIERISDIDKMMHNPGLYDFWDIDEWYGLRVIEQLLEREDTSLAHEALHTLRVLMDNLISEVTQTWEIMISIPPTHNHLKQLNQWGVIGQRHSTYHSIDEDRLKYVEPQDFTPATAIMAQLNSVQTLLCASPYNEVGMDLEARFWDVSKSRLAGYEQKKYSELVQEATRALGTFLASNPRIQTDPLWVRTLQLTDHENPTVEGISQFNRPIVSLDHLEAEVKNRLRPITLSWERHNFETPLNITRHLLLTLTDNELKYLPLWCGGCNDGTGGVFEDPIPATDMGPKGPGPSFHTGQTIPSAPVSISGSMVEDMDALRVWGSTTGASINVQDSISTVYRPDQVIAEDKSIASESFTMGGSEYSDARFAMPADHQGMGEAVNMLVDTVDETRDSESRSATEGRSAEGNDSDGDDDMYMWDSDDTTHTLS
ncbi:hypothetical protein FLONG3_6234 [Fusarium longipes]|uniref:Uncharacterized protein n=1 Tax=Fusarium longipes TaxID=694270 RepID=A0A395SMS5_9HYPO|nr:hypothetical protein FLONG3_6234 [Fusarium longipes]